MAPRLLDPRSWNGLAAKVRILEKAGKPPKVKKEMQKFEMPVKDEKMDKDQMNLKTKQNFDAPNSIVTELKDEKMKEDQENLKTEKNFYALNSTETELKYVEQRLLENFESLDEKIAKHVASLEELKLTSKDNFEHLKGNMEFKMIAGHLALRESFEMAICDAARVLKLEMKEDYERSLRHEMHNLNIRMNVENVQVTLRNIELSRTLGNLEAKVQNSIDFKESLENLNVKINNLELASRNYLKEEKWKKETLKELVSLTAMDKSSSEEMLKPDMIEKMAVEEGWQDECCWRRRVRRRGLEDCDGG